MCIEMAGVVDMNIDIQANSPQVATYGCCYNPAIQLPVGGHDC